MRSTAHNVPSILHTPNILGKYRVHFVPRALRVLRYTGGRNTASTGSVQGIELGTTGSIRITDSLLGVPPVFSSRNTLLLLP